MKEIPAADPPVPLVVVVHSFDKRFLDVDTGTFHSSLRCDSMPSLSDAAKAIAAVPEILSEQSSPKPRSPQSSVSLFTSSVPKEDVEVVCLFEQLQQANNHALNELRNSDGVSLFTLSTRECDSIHSNSVKEQIEAESDHDEDDSMPQPQAAGFHCNLSLVEAIQNGDESYFTEGFVSVGDLPCI